MITLGKKSRNGMLTFCQINGFTFRTVAHVNMSVILSYWFA